MMKNMKEWLVEFKKAHERYRQNELSGADRKAYLDAREQLASALLNAQGLPRQANETARQAFRVAQALQVELRLGDARMQSLTHDLSRGGFSGLFIEKLDMDQPMSFTLKLPGGADPLSGKAKVVAARKQGSGSRYSFAFINMPDSDQDRLETLLFDLALARMNF
jgi:hypothetical protein